MKFLSKNWFLVGIVVALILSTLIPQVGVALAQMKVRTVAILLIFLMSGCTVSLGRMGRDLSRWQAHTTVFVFVYVLAPALFYFTSGWLGTGPLREGAFLLAVLPTTISSCVVYTLASGGRVSTALLNAVGLNLLGLFLSPFLLSVFIGANEGIDWHLAGRSILNLTWLALLPFVVGQVAARMSDEVSVKVKRVQSKLAQLCVLMIVFTAFSESSAEVLEGLRAMGFAVLYFVAGHLVLVALAMAAVRVIRFRPDEATAVVFCSTQKTLVLGIPLAYSYFDHSKVALVLVPVLIYHLFMLSFGGLLVAYWSKKNAAARGGG